MNSSISATAVLAALLWGLLCYTQAAPPQTSLRYSFEKGKQGWQHQTYNDSQACEQVDTTSAQEKDGSHSLKMSIDLVGGDAHRSKGEAWVDWTKTAPGNEKVPLDLSGRTITAWVYAPKGAAGENSSSNGFQIFIKDSEWRGEYGTWNNVEEGQWTMISLTVSTTAPDDGWMASGFDPKHIVALGVKMGAGELSKAKYKGPVFVDTISW